MNKRVGQPKTLDNEIVRLGNTHWNKTEAPAEAIVKNVNIDHTVDLEFNPGSTSRLLIQNVPLMQPITTGNGLNVVVGSRVVVAFMGGVFSNPFVIGKF
ncbi:hypothetical protein [Methanobacterium sp. MBAC-LM]|uniref:hypothetical protein n=1 Tax=Methanobacterium sp. MBAC-LM TaxID=3412034 RepID=UPI003C78A8AE